MVELRTTKSEAAVSGTGLPRARGARAKRTRDRNIILLVGVDVNRMDGMGWEEEEEGIKLAAGSAGMDE